MNLRFFFALEWEVHRVWLRGREEEQRKKSEGIVDLKRIRSEGKAKENRTRIGGETDLLPTRGRTKVELYGKRLELILKRYANRLNNAKLL